MANDNTALARRQETSPAPFEPADLGQAYQLAENLAQASLLPSYLRGKPADVFMTLLLGRDLGLTAMQAITGIHVIEGKPSVSAGLAVALVKRSPLCVFFRQVESNDAVATYETQRKGEPQPARMSYTIEQARRAGLAGKKNWASFPDAMLRARCSMALARDVYPDVVANVYDPDELDAAVERAEVIIAPPPAPPPPARPTPPPKPANEQKAPKRTAACGTCGRAPAEHLAGAGPSGLAIDAACNLEPVTRPPEPGSAGGMSADADVPERPASQGFTDIIEGPRLADSMGRSMDAAETMPQLDALAASIKTGVADGTITDAEKGQLLARYRDNKKRLGGYEKGVQG